MHYLENKELRGVSIPNRENPSTLGLRLGKKSHRGSILGILGPINESTEERSIPNDSRKNITCEDIDRRRSNLKDKTLLGANVHKEIAILEEQQLSLRQQMSIFRRQMLQETKERDELITRLRGDLESAMSKSVGEGCEESSNLDSMKAEQMEKELASVEREICYLYSSQIDKMRDKEQDIQRLQEGTEEVKTELSDCCLNEKLVLRKIQEANEIKTTLEDQIKLAENSIQETRKVLSKCSNWRSTLVTGKEQETTEQEPSKETQIRLKQLEKVYRRLQEIEESSRAFYSQDLEAATFKYQEELTTLRQIADRRRFRVRTSGRSTCTFHNLLNEDIVRWEETSPSQKLPLTMRRIAEMINEGVLTTRRSIYSTFSNIPETQSEIVESKESENRQKLYRISEETQNPQQKPSSSSSSYHQTLVESQQTLSEPPQHREGSMGEGAKAKLLKRCLFVLAGVGVAVGTVFYCRGRHD